MEVVLIRHTSVDVPPGVCYGQTDVALKSTFEEEAKAVMERLDKYLPFDMVYTSPLSRCTQLAAKCGYPNAVHDKRLMEINFGEWEMQRYEKITDPRLQEWYDNYLNVTATGGESFMMQYERVGSFLDEIKALPYNRIALFTHGGVLLCAQLYAKQIKPEEAFSSLTPYGGVISISL